MYSNSYSFADLSTPNPLLKSIYSKNRHINHRYLTIIDTTKGRVLSIILARAIFQKQQETFFEFVRKNKIASTRSAFKRDLVSLSMIFKAEKGRSTRNLCHG